MPKKYITKTPLGEFGTLRQAAAAHHVTPSRITERINNNESGYQRIEIKIQRKPQVVQPRAARGTWPLTWVSYKLLDDFSKENLYHTWCNERGLDPDLECTANAFFDEMDAYVPATEEIEDEIL